MFLHHGRTEKANQGKFPQDTIVTQNCWGNINKFYKIRIDEPSLKIYQYRILSLVWIGQSYKDDDGKILIKNDIRVRPWSKKWPLNQVLEFEEAKEEEKGLKINNTLMF